MKRWLPAALVVSAAGFFLGRSYKPGDQPAPPRTELPALAKATDTVDTATPTGPKKPEHWAFKVPVRPALPRVQNSAWCRTPVDYFVLARLEKEGLKPSPEADRVTLLRRLYLDLIGLPPTPKEVDEFLADKDPRAYEHAVDRLLASPHYGERWGRHWLDAARYADTDGYEKDKLRWIYFYRDWIVSALNRDLPYDQFVIQQLAGDLLPNPTQDQVVATGFLRNSMLNEEGGVDPEQFRMDAMFDRMDAVGKSILGVTIQCCQCHNHKFDPMMQEEYYRLFAFLNNDHEGSRTVYTPEQQQKVAELSRKIREIEAGLKEMPDLDQRMAAWEKSVRSNQPEWTVLELDHVGDNGQRYMPRKDGSLLAAGYAPTKHTPTFKTTTHLKEIRSFRLELLTDPDLPCGGPGRSYRGLFGLTEFKVEAVDPKNPKTKVAVKFEKATADFGNSETELEPIFDDKSKKRRVTGPVTYAIDGKDETAWGIDAGPGRRNVDRKAVFATSKNIAFPEGTELKIFLVQNHGGWNSDDNQNMNLGRFRISVTGAPVEVDPLPKRVRDILAIPTAQRTHAQRDEVFSYYRTTVEEWKEQNELIEDLWRQWPAGDSTLTLAKLDQPRETHLLNRGDFLKPGKVVGAGVPAFLHPLADDKAPANRLTLAKWLVDPRSPTTARVFVNRVWQEYFGTGLVATPEDFGTQGQKPSHPELLDWLACEFMSPADGRPWGIKDLHRVIVNSATYRQSSAVTPALLEKDPYNKLLARQTRVRVDGEIVRDVALAASGLLNPKVGGPGVFAPAPAFLFLPPASYGPFTWIDATGPDRYRRGLYTFRRRSTPYPALQNFDVPNGDFSCVRRTRSNTPLQALTTLNETVFTECARAMAQRVLREGGSTDEERLRYAFRLCVAREPSGDELSELTKLMQKQRKRLMEHLLDPGEVATGSRGKDASDLEPAVFTLVSRALLNLDETITRE
jgi:hypothetical protein